MTRGILRQSERDAIFREVSVVPRTAKKWDEPGKKCEYCKAPPTHAIKHSEGMAYVQTCDKHLQNGKDDAAACVPWGDPDPSNIDKVKRIAGDVVPFKHPHLQWLDQLPDHDWTQHTLGDPEDWAAEQHPRNIDAALGDYGAAQFPGTDNLSDTGTTLGTHHSQVWENPSNKDQWLIKQPPKSAPFLAHGDVGASAIQQHSGLPTPPTFLTQVGSKPASAQLMYPGAKDAFPGKAFDPETVGDDDMLTIQKHHALDWLLGNHDAHGGQFIRDQGGQLIGIDKGQAFKHYSQDRLHWNYHPNSTYNEQEPVYNTLYRNHAQGGRPVYDPRTGELGKYIQGLQDTPDDELASTLTPYANGAASAGSLAIEHGGYDGHAPARFQANNPAAFLKAAIDRKNNLMNDFGDLYDRATAHRMTGTKIARTLRKVAYYPDPHHLIKDKDQSGDLGSHGAQVYTDPQGQWIVKKPRPGNEFMVPLDVGVASLQRRAGLEGPETYVAPAEGDLATVVKRYPGATHPFGGEDGATPPRHSELSPQDLETIQKHQALDWLIANHDGHVGNWMRKNDGTLVGIDKGQAMKYFGRDRLDPNFHPNYYAREPIYNSLWRQHIRGEGQMNDPNQGAVGDFVKNLQSIPDDELKGMFRPYAHAAAKAGVLATGGPPDPQRGLTRPTVTPNDPETFLNGLVGRKNSLHRDLGHLYDKANHARQQTARSQPVQEDPIGAIQTQAARVLHGLGGGLLNVGLGLAESGGLPKLPQLPKPPSSTNPTDPTSAQTTPTGTPSSGQGDPAAAAVSAGGTGGTTVTGPHSTPAAGMPSMNYDGLPASKGYNPSQQGGWAALGIPTGLPSSFKGKMPGMPSTPGVPGSSGGSGGPGAPTNYTPSAGVDQWEPQIAEGLRRNGLPTTPDYINKVKHQMQTESSGDPKAINRTDSNAQAGHPSQGLMQTIPSTFQQYHLPGDSSDITDPQANIDSAIGYAKSTYGPGLMNEQGNGMGSGHGY